MNYRINVNGLTFKKLNLGCGASIFSEFLNIGYWVDLEKDMLYKEPTGIPGTYLLNHDLSNGIPVEDESIELIYNSHFLEHLDIKQALNFLKECNRVIQPGGLMRILVPDIESFIKAYVEKNDFFFESYRKILDKEIYTTRGAIFMGMLHNHGHKFGYDYETLKWIVESTGFTEVKRTLYGESEIKNIAEIEPLNPLRMMESVCIECWKR